MTDKLTAAVIDSIIQAGLRHNGYGEYLTPETPLREIHFEGGDVLIVHDCQGFNEKGGKA